MNEHGERCTQHVIQLILSRADYTEIEAFRKVGLTKAMAVSGLKVKASLNLFKLQVDRWGNSDHRHCRRHEEPGVKKAEFPGIVLG